MKKIFTIVLLILTFIITLSLSACDSQNYNNSSSDTSMMTDSEYDAANSLANQILNSTSSQLPNQFSTSQAQNKQPEKIVDSNGKTIWKVYCSPTWYQYIHFSSTYKGTGNFIIEVLDSNQNLYEVIVNKIGDYVLDKTVNAPPLDDKGYFYIQQEITNGSTTGNWNCTNNN